MLYFHARAQARLLHALACISKEILVYVGADHLCGRMQFGNAARRLGWTRCEIENGWIGMVMKQTRHLFRDELPHRRCHVLVRHGGELQLCIRYSRKTAKPPVTRRPTQHVTIFTALTVIIIGQEETTTSDPSTATLLYLCKTPAAMELNALGIVTAVTRSNEVRARDAQREPSMRLGVLVFSLSDLKAYERAAQRAEEEEVARRQRAADAAAERAAKEAARRAEITRQMAARAAAGTPDGSASGEAARGAARSAPSTAKRKASKQEHKGQRRAAKQAKS